MRSSDGVLKVCPFLLLKFLKFIFLSAELLVFFVPNFFQKIKTVFDPFSSVPIHLFLFFLWLSFLFWSFLIFPADLDYLIFNSLPARKFLYLIDYLYLYFVNSLICSFSYLLILFITSIVFLLFYISISNHLMSYTFKLIQTLL